MECPAAVDLPALRRACKKVMDRHVAFRAESIDPRFIAQMHLTAAESLVLLREGGPLRLRSFANALGRVLFWCWPRYRDNPENQWDVGEHDVWREWKVKEIYDKHGKNNFYPPGGLDIIKLFDENAPDDSPPQKVFLSIYLAHSVADGYSYVPSAVY